jgi:hypothetical protein
MLSMNRMNNLILIIALCVVASCGRTPAAKVKEQVAKNQKSTASVVSLPQTNLVKIGHLTAKGRVQDANDSPEVKNLLARGTESIPDLIGELNNETKIEGHVLDYWSEVEVGDVALIILIDFFTDGSWQRTTIAGVGWDEFLERGDNNNLTSEQVLRNYIAKYGRNKIKDRWQEIWTQYRDRIFWDDGERCFKVRSS